MNSAEIFAGFDSSFDKASYVLLGVPYDKTSSFRTGTSKGPEEIRKASYCFEPYLMEHDISLNQIDLHDVGDLDGFRDYEELREDVSETISKIVSKGKFPITLGGEHSISPPIVSSVKKSFSDLNVVILDAHLDFRDIYEGIEHSHATVSRRISEIVGLENIIVGGVRSVSMESAEKGKPIFFTSEQIKREDDPIKKILERINEPLYLSIDMDVVDPAFAPGVGNPEPFGLSSVDMKELVSRSSPYLVGMDIVETNPKYDDSAITANLASRMIYELIGSREKKKG
ncbi:MAG: agmatinase [Candidatus Thermoplasmatota archaeon]|nr:agmatinase [Candidatus Thermoplasmatota archaeon]MBS3790407.1 agmatinase [Candidatus Thermoplasmatota archaeon]